MAVPLNPAATEHLPSFITAPGETDILMVITAVILAVAILTFGLVFFRLHSLPERMAHRSHKLQFEIVAVLCLIALLTHIHAFWLAALLLALIDIPDFGGWLGRITGAVETMAGLKPGGEMARVPPPEPVVDTKDTKHAEVAAAAPPDAKSRTVRPKEQARA